eukprot:2353806-Prymnesium_polylepis.1
MGTRTMNASSRKPIAHTRSTRYGPDRPKWKWKRMLRCRCTTPGKSQLFSRREIETPYGRR